MSGGPGDEQDADAGRTATNAPEIDSGEELAAHGLLDMSSGSPHVSERKRQRSSESPATEEPLVPKIAKAFSSAPQDTTR
eukprot:scaffold436783_cov47-Prasinocladus_malaysianus.AAC.1